MESVEPAGIFFYTLLTWSWPALVLTKHTFVLPFDVKKNLGCATKVLCLAWEEEDAARLLGHGWISGCPSAPLISSLTAPRSDLTDLWVQVLKTRFPEGTSTCERMRCLLLLLFLAVRCYFVFTALCLSIRLPSGWNYSVGNTTASTVAHVKGQGSCS